MAYVLLGVLNFLLSYLSVVFCIYLKEVKQGYETQMVSKIISYLGINQSYFWVIFNSLKQAK